MNFNQWKKQKLKIIMLITLFVMPSLISCGEESGDDTSLLFGALLLTNKSSNNNNGISKQWTRLLGVSGQYTRAESIAADSTGNIYITGFTAGDLDGETLIGSQDLFVVKYDSEGTKQWTKLLGVAGKETYAQDVITDSSENIYITGYIFSYDEVTNISTSDLFVVKYNSEGTKQWTTQLGVADEVTHGYGITIDSSGNIYVAGDTTGDLDGETLTGGSDLFIVKYNSEGTKQWITLLGVDSRYTYASDITIDSSGNLYVTGKTTGDLDGETGTSDNDLFVVKYDSEGTKQWTRLLGVANEKTNANGITTDSFGNIYVAGWTTGDLSDEMLTGDEDLFLVKYDSEGTKQWTNLLGVIDENTLAQDLLTDSSGNIYVTGFTYGDLDGETLIGSQDLFVVKYDSEGTKQWTNLMGVDDGGTSAFGITMDSSENLYVTGKTAGNLDGETLTGISDLFVVKYQ